MSGIISFAFQEISVSEKDGVALLPILRTGDTTRAVTVTYSVQGETATENVDFTAIPLTQTVIPAGVDRIVIEVPIRDDALSESTETFIANIVGIDSGTFGLPRTMVVDILDDENPVTQPVSPPLSTPYGVSVVDAITGLVQPIAMEWAPGDSSTLFVASKAGVIQVIDTDTGARTTFADISAEVNNVQDRGLLDLALHPNFPEEPYVYAFYVVDPPDVRNPDGFSNRFNYLVRFEADPATGFTTAKTGPDGKPLKVIMAGGAARSINDVSGDGFVDSTINPDTPPSNVDPVTGEYIQNYLLMDSITHAGGSIAFGPDGMLYVSLGDGITPNAAVRANLGVQDPDSAQGKVWRIDPITGQGRTDNPFYESGLSLDSNRSKVWMLGLRNPYAIAFLPDGRLAISETGWSTYEEINVGGRGANFGWPFYEGGDDGVNLPTRLYKDFPEASQFYADVAAGLIAVQPAYRAFAHSEAAPGYQVQAIVGANTIYDGDVYPEEFGNSYFFTDISQGEVFAVSLSDRRDIKYLFTNQTPIGPFGPVHFKQGPDGYIYMADLIRGVIARIEITDSPPQVGLKVEYFAISSGVNVLADIDFSTAPQFVSYVDRIDFNPGRGQIWPGGPEDNVAISFSGDFAAPASGAYTFYLTSDDGSALYVDGQLVVNNDGRHAAALVSGAVTLSAGVHEIEVRYFESRGGALVKLEWSGPGVARQVMPFDLPIERPVGEIADIDVSADIVFVGAPAGTAVGVVAQADDPDVGDTVAYALANNAGGRFAINPTTGVVTTARAMTQADLGDRTIDVVATSSDGSVSQRSFVIDVEPPATNTVAVRFGGTGGPSGTPQFELRLDGLSYGVFSVTTPATTLSGIQYQNIVVEKSGLAPRLVEIEYLNDGFSDGVNRDLRVDYIEVNGVRFETEDFAVSSVFSNGLSFTGRDTQYRNGQFTFADLPDATGGNAAPVIFPVSPVLIAEGQTAFFSVQAEDLDSDRLTLSAKLVDTGTGADVAPSRYSFVDEGDGIGTFVFTADYSSAGQYAAIVTASDGAKSTTRAVPISVADADPSQQSTLLIRAGGTGTIAEPPRFEVLVDGVSVGQRSVKTPASTLSTISFADEVFVVNDADIDRIDIVFLNDGSSGGVNRDLRVDFIEIDGTRFQTETSATSTAFISGLTFTGRDTQYAAGQFTFDDLGLV